MKTETIAAIATGMSNSGIGIVRISGDQAFEVIDRIYRNKRGRQEHYGTQSPTQPIMDIFMMVMMKGSMRFWCLLCGGQTAIQQRIPLRLIVMAAFAWFSGFWKRSFITGQEPPSRESLPSAPFKRKAGSGPGRGSGRTDPCIQ